jgi:hypothetical protein
MAFSWNKWRQYVIEEASVNEEVDGVGEMLPFFSDAASMGIIRKVDAQRATEAGNNSEDLDAFESTQEFQQIGKNIIMAAVDALEKSGRETHYLYQKFGQGTSKPIEGADISNAVNILRTGGAMSAVGMALPEGEKSLINPEAEEISPEDLEAASDMLASLAEEDKFDKPGWDLRAIMDSFKEDFEEATRDTDDIPYAQSRVVDAYKDVFTKSHPQLAGEIDAYLNKLDAETRKMFQNVADDPEVVGRDMMGENYENDPEFAPKMPEKGSTLEKGDTVYLKFDKDKQRPMTIKRFAGQARMSANPNEKQWVVINPDGDEATYTQSELVAEMEGEVQTEVDAFDEAMNDMAIERAMVAKKLDTMQNELEATLSQDEIDTLSDAIVLLRQK